MTSAWEFNSSAAAANAEESAATSEELNAQAITMKESVAELLQLVGGKSRRNATKSNEAPAQAKVVRHEVPKIKLTTLVRRNGHAHVKPPLSSTANDRSEIP